MKTQNQTKIGRGVRGEKSNNCGAGASRTTRRVHAN